MLDRVKRKFTVEMRAAGCRATGVWMRSSTTTLALSAELKVRIAAAAQQSGKTAPAFIAEALELQTGLAERPAAFVPYAVLAREEVARCRRVVDADDALDYLRARAESSHAHKPDPSSI